VPVPLLTGILRVKRRPFGGRDTMIGMRRRRESLTLSNRQRVFQDYLDPWRDSRTRQKHDWIWDKANQPSLSGEEVREGLSAKGCSAFHHPLKMKKAWVGKKPQRLGVRSAASYSLLRIKIVSAQLDECDR